MTLRSFGLSLIAILAAGCSNAGTYVVLVVDAQPAARSGATTLRIRVSSPDGTLRRDETLALSGVAFPVRVPLTPAGNDASRGWVVDAILYDAVGGGFTSARARGGYEAGATREAGLCVFAGCAGIDCGLCDASACDTCRGAACASATVTLGPMGSAARCPATCLPIETACADRTDDDCDGSVDCADTDCACLDAGPDFDGGPELDAGPTLDAGCAPGGSELGVAGGCSNGIDDDCDRAVDCADADCACVDSGPSCPGFVLENTVALCHDGIDNDCDGVRDCAEGPDCRIAEGPAGCRNALDDDCDGMIDCEELGCAREACGPGGERCCSGVCVDTYGDEANCGACGYACDPARICVRVPDATGGLSGAACRCGVDGDCLRASVCESHDGAMVCNCTVDGDCAGGATCRGQGAAHHSYCGY